MVTARPHVYICTPLRPEVGDPGWRDPASKAERKVALAANVEFAEKVSRMVALAGGVPYAPHLLLPRFLDDDVPEERLIGIECGLAELARKDELWAVLPTWRRVPSYGMSKEREGATALSIPVFDMDIETIHAHLGRLRAGTFTIRIA